MSQQRTPRSWSFWLGFLVGTVLTIGLLVWQTHRAQRLLIIEPTLLPMPTNLFITSTDEACPVLLAPLPPAPVLALQSPQQEGTGAWRDCCSCRQTEKPGARWPPRGARRGPAHDCMSCGDEENTPCLPNCASLW